MTTIPYNYEPRIYQEPLFDCIADGYKRGVGIWHRRAGKDKTLLNLMVKEACKRVGVYYYFFPTYNQGRKVLWDGIDRQGFRYMAHIPEEIRENTNQNEMKIKLVNGSLIQVIGTDNIDAIMGTNPIGCVFSEYSLQNPDAWDLIRPILAENGGWAVFNYTPRGRNHGYVLYTMAQNNPEWFCQLLTIDDTGAVSPDVVQAEREAGMSEEMIKQEFYCFPPDALISTDHGLKKIQDIKINDIVLTHAGRYRKVKATTSREYDGNLSVINTYGFKENIVSTSTHPIQLIDPSNQTYSWVNAEDVKKGQFISGPRLSSIHKILPRHLITLLAWYIVEGSLAKNAVNFTLSHNEKEEALQIEQAAIEYGCKTCRTENESIINVIAKSVDLADFLHVHCGSGAENKHIPFTLTSGYEQEVFDILMKGDGCQAKTKHEEFYSFTTISEHLAYDVQLLSGTLGYRAGITERINQCDTIMGRKVNISPSYAVQIRYQGKATKIKPARHGVGYMVKSVITRPYSGPVHNLSVQYDESYVVYGRSVHNCSFEAALSQCFFAGALEGHDYVRTGQRANVVEGEVTLANDGLIEFWRYPYNLLKGWDDLPWLHRYCIGSDISEGLDGDYSVAYVYDRHFKEFVARMSTNKIDSYKWGDRLHALSLVYGNALIVPERNGAGITTINRLIELKANLYVKEIVAGLGKQITKQWGFLETKESKQSLCGGLKAYLGRDKKPKVYCRVLLQECAVFIKDEEKEKLGAEVGFHDDHVIAAALCLIGDSYLPKCEKVKPEPTGWVKRLQEEKGRENVWAA